MIANPMRVAMEELQLHDLKNMEAAVEVQQKTSPAKHEDAIEPIPVAMGRESRRPMVVCVEY